MSNDDSETTLSEQLFELLIGMWSQNWCWSSGKSSNRPGRIFTAAEQEKLLIKWHSHLGTFLTSDVNSETTFLWVARKVVHLKWPQNWRWTSGRSPRRMWFLTISTVKPPQCIIMMILIIPRGPKRAFTVPPSRPKGGMGRVSRYYLFIFFLWCKEMVKVETYKGNVLCDVISFIFFWKKLGVIVS